MTRNIVGISLASLRLAVSMSALLSAGVVHSQSTVTVPAAEAEAQADVDSDAIIVLGSRSGTARALDSSAPLQVVGASELRDAGALNLSEALQKSVPSFHFPAAASGASAVNFVKGVSLRGLAADQSLVLIDGKRRHVTAQINPNSGVSRGAQTVDLNTIPLSAIQRVEVLLDGAAAQYGSDAIAGVVNIVLKKSRNAGNIAVQYLGNENGDGRSKSVEGSFGLALPGEGTLTVAFDAWNTGRTRLSVPDTRTMYFPGDPREATFANRNWFHGTGQSKRQNVVINGETSLGDVVAYAVGSYSWRQDEGSGNLRQPSADQTVRALFPDGYVPTLSVRSRDASLGGGLRWSSAAAGDFDLSVNYGRNRVKAATGNTVNASLGTASPTSFNTGDLLNEQLNAALDWKRPVETSLFAAPLNIAAGVAYRREAYQVFQGDYASWVNGGVPILDGPNAGKVATPGSQGFGGFSPDDAGRLTRNVIGGYLELETLPVKNLRVTASSRVERYSDFGWTTNARLALRYEASDSLAWRGSAGTGYRAPSLGQAGFSRTIPNFVNGVLASNRLARVNSGLAKALGATSLKPEKSINLSTGLVWTPDPAFSATVDVYQTKVNDRVILSETLTGPLVRQVLANAGFPTFSGASFFTNAADTRTRGVDVTALYRLRLGEDHQLNLGVGFNWGETRITSVKDTPAVLAGSGLTLVGREARALIEEANPDTVLRVTADYTLDRFAVNASAVRYGVYRDRNATNPALDQRFGSQIVANLAVSYRVFDGARFLVGAKNLFGSHPDKVIPAARNPVVAVYSRLAPEGGAGRILYGRIEYSF